MSRFYLPTPDEDSPPVVPPRPPTPPDDDDDEKDENAPMRPPPPSGPSRPPPPSGRPQPKRGAPPPPAVTSAKKAASLQRTPGASSVSPISSSSSQASAAPARNSSSAASVSRVSSGDSAKSSKGATISPVASGSGSRSSSGRRFDWPTPPGSQDEDSSPARLKRAQTWSGKRPSRSSSTTSAGPTVFTAARSSSPSDDAKPTPKSPPPNLPTKPARLSRSSSAAEPGAHPQRPILQRRTSDPEGRDLSIPPRPLLPRSMSSSKSSVSSIAEVDGEEGTTAAVPSRPGPPRPPPARPAPPRPPPARPPPAFKPSGESTKTPSPPPPTNKPQTSKPPAYIPTRKVSKPKPDKRPSASTAETSKSKQNGSPSVVRRMNETVRAAIKKVSPPTRPRSKSGRFLEDTNASQPVEDEPAGRKRVWQSIRRVKRSVSTDTGRPRSNSSAKSRPAAATEELDELGVLNRLVVQCVGYLNTPRGLSEEGLFRVPGDMTEIGKLRTKFIHGEEVDLSDIMDPNTVAGLLKLHFRELRFSIIPRGEPSKSLLEAMKANDVAEAKRVMAAIPQDNLASLRILLELFVKVNENEEVNKMSSANLGQTCGMAIFHDMGAANSAFVLRFLIDNKDEVMP